MVSDGIKSDNKNLKRLVNLRPYLAIWSFQQSQDSRRGEFHEWKSRKFERHVGGEIFLLWATFWETPFLFGCLAHFGLVLRGCAALRSADPIHAFSYLAPHYGA